MGFYGRPRRSLSIWLIHRVLNGCLFVWNKRGVTLSIVPISRLLSPDCGVEARLLIISIIIVHPAAVRDRFTGLVPLVLTPGPLSLECGKVANGKWCLHPVCVVKQRVGNATDWVIENRRKLRLYHLISVLRCRAIWGTIVIWDKWLVIVLTFFRFGTGGITGFS